MIIHANVHFLIATLLAISRILTTSSAAHSQERVISANCGKAGIVTLKISNNQAHLKIPKLRLLIGGSVFSSWGGQSTSFSSSDNKVSFVTTRGHGAGQLIDHTELKMESGVFSCIALN